MAISYSVGAFASVVYLNMLNRSIDGFGSSEGGSLASQPRLLIPLVLAMGFNRCRPKRPPLCNSVGRSICQPAETCVPMLLS